MELDSKRPYIDFYSYNNDSTREPDICAFNNLRLITTRGTEPTPFIFKLLKNRYFLIRLTTLMTFIRDVLPRLFRNKENFEGYHSELLPGLLNFMRGKRKKFNPAKPHIPEFRLIYS
ncbi:hypothetical protein BpHYR1_037200 [Brachionus plicatilis]|uniref:Uncharacterized protein n=1 Tax=Brachionus plicatilis TaxID=10195 RepID=A0A3M7SI33_BRAPC|nr:hypothetical protein BpHYR1_037200 [Brachionus plicatilis]